MPTTRRSTHPQEHTGTPPCSVTPPAAGFRSMSEPDAETPRGRRALPITLVVIATITLLVGSFAIWAKRQLLETDTWVDTSTELLADTAIQEALASFLVASLYNNVDVEAELAAKLPPQVQPLAGPISGGLRQLADEVAKKALAQPQVQDALGGGEPRRALPVPRDHRRRDDGGLHHGWHGRARARHDPQLDRRPVGDRRRRGREAAARRGVAGDHAVGRARGGADGGERLSHHRLGTGRADPDPLRARDLSRRQPAAPDPAR